VGGGDDSVNLEVLWLPAITVVNTRITVVSIAIVRITVVCAVVTAVVVLANA
jgi:hypothetical protein